MARSPICHSAHRFPLADSVKRSTISGECGLRFPLARCVTRLRCPGGSSASRDHPTKPSNEIAGALSSGPRIAGALSLGPRIAGAISWRPGWRRDFVGALGRCEMALPFVSSSAGPSAWIRAIQAENLASGTTSGMMFAARSEHAETACRVALVRRASASHRPRGLRCQALVLVVPEGALLSKTTRPSVRTPARKSTQPASRAWRRCAERCSGRWRLDAARIVTPRTVKSSIHSR